MYDKLLMKKGFSLNEYPEGKFWELEVTDNEDLKKSYVKFLVQVLIRM